MNGWSDEEAWSTAATLARWLREADHIKQQYFNDKRQQTNGGQHLLPDDKSPTHNKTIDAIEIATNTLSVEPKDDVCLANSAALPDGSDGGVLLLVHRVDVTSPVLLDGATVIASVYSDTYKLCGCIQEMMTLHRVTIIDDINTDAMWNRW